MKKLTYFFMQMYVSFFKKRKAPKTQGFRSFFYGSPCWTRTNDPAVNSRMLCQTYAKATERHALKKRRQAAVVFEVVLPRCACATFTQIPVRTLRAIIAGGANHTAEKRAMTRGGF